MKQIAIIGAGASGMFAAITAASLNKNANVTIFERLDRVGKKILATGNGRCNLTNTKADKIETVNGIQRPVHFHGLNPEFAAFALKEYSVKNTLDFFENLGVMLRLEEDKYYPYSEQAGTILDVLRFKCEQKNISITTNSKIEIIKQDSNKFKVNNQTFDCVIIATGGKSSPHLGSDGSGYELLKAFNHKLTKLYPAITQIKTETDFVKQLKGIKCDANVSILINNKVEREEFGQVLFAEYGLSGPPVFQLSSLGAMNYERDCKISLDFFPNLEFEEIKQKLYNIIKNPFKENLSLEDFLMPILNKRLSQVVLKKCGFKLSQLAIDLNKNDIEKITSELKNFTLKVTGVQSFNNAQITAGGIQTKDFDFKTMQSKLTKNLYACGEVLDIHGDCGGYNLQWAFSSGYLAGKSAATKEM